MKMFLQTVFAGDQYIDFSEILLIGNFQNQIYIYYIV